MTQGSFSHDNMFNFYAGPFFFHVSPYCVYCDGVLWHAEYTQRVSLSLSHVSLSLSQYTRVLWWCTLTRRVHAACTERERERQLSLSHGVLCVYWLCINLFINLFINFAHQSVHAEYTIMYQLIYQLIYQHCTSEMVYSDTWAKLIKNDMLIDAVNCLAGWLVWTLLLNDISKKLIHNHIFTYAVNWWASWLLRTLSLNDISKKLIYNHVFT